jgi:hypothetical protein
MAARKSISKKTRFEVLKRDSFTCQYCGRSAPEIVLQLDHIHPISKDGDDGVFNYITSCEDCNQGKKDRLLSDDSVVQKQKHQLDQLQERREQIEMMLEWREGLKSLDADTVQIAVEAFNKRTPGWSLNENGRKDFSKLVKKYGLQTVLDAIDTAAEQYIMFNKYGNATAQSFDLAFSKLGGICRLCTQPEEERKLYYFRGILRNRLAYFNDWKGLQMLREAFAAGVSIEDLEYCARNADSWTWFKSFIEESIRLAKKEVKTRG